MQTLSEQSAFFLRFPPAIQLLKTLNAEQPDAARFVGGCVRNAVMNCSSEKDDIDIATVFPPETVKKICKKAGFHTIDTGIAHGTVTVSVEKNLFEITTLRKDVTTDGRHAEIAFCDSYFEDAQRRDFTYNALYSDEAGKIYDYTGGVTDALLRKTRFIGNPKQRITEDYLRILRFFRFQSCYGSLPICEAALQACKDRAVNLRSVSRERIRSELLKMLQGKFVESTLYSAEKAGVIAVILPDPTHASFYPVFSALSFSPPPHYLLTVLSEASPEKLKDALRLTSKEEKNLIDLQKIQAFILNEKTSLIDFFMLRTEYPIEAIRFILEKNIYLQKSGLTRLQTLSNALSIPLPELNFSGKNLIAQGYQPGPAIAQEILRLKRAAIEEYLKKITF